MFNYYAKLYPNGRPYIEVKPHEAHTYHSPTVTTTYN